MRMWGILPERMCNKHLLGEHFEMHMFIGTIKKGRSIQGYIDKGLVDPSKIVIRHDRLAIEMMKRGMSHLSPIIHDGEMQQGRVDPGSCEELLRRCKKCGYPGGKE